MHLHPARRSVLLSICVVLSAAWVHAQCPVITDSGLDQTEFEFCTGDVLTFTTEGTDLPAGDMIDWFISLAPGFNPYEGDGATVGTAPITADPCFVEPEILYLMVNPDNTQVGSGDDRCDEFIIMYTGSGGYTPNDILVSNLGGGDIWDDFVPGNIATFNCGITLNPTDPVPPNSILVIQANANNNVMVDLGPLCTSGLSVYIIAYNPPPPAPCFGGYLDNSSAGGCGSCPVMLDITGTCTYSIEMNYTPPAVSTNGWGVSNLLGGGVYANVVPAVTIPPYTPGGTVVAPFVWTIPADFCSTFPPGTYYVKGILNPAPIGGCPQIFTNEFEISISCPTAAISGDASICTQNCPDDPGQVSLEFAGGAEPYVVDLQITATGFPPLSLTGLMFNAMETINVCIGGAIPSYNVGTQTLMIPDAVAGNQVSVEIISVEDAEGCTGTISPASVTINLFESPVAIAGNDTTICDGSFIQLNGSIDGSAQSSRWITSGDGSFGNPFMPQTTYSPGATDVAMGTVTLTLIAMDAGNICEPDSSSVVVSIVQSPTANAGTDIDICEGQVIQVNGATGGSAVSSEWITSGDGSFGNPVLLQTTYAPGVLDIANGSVTLTLIASGPGNVCAPDSSALLVTIFQNPSTDAGNDTTLCSGSIVQLTGIVNGAMSSEWSTSGDGIFADPSMPQTTYVPGVTDIANASVILTLIAESANGCDPDTSSIIVSIIESPQAEAGSDQTICATDAAVLNGMISGGATSLIWSSSGDGSFTDNSDPATSYIPGPGDRTAGSVILYLTTDDIVGQCDPAVDSLVLTLVNPPVISGPSNGTICAGEAGLLPHTASGNIGSIQWTTNGDGFFDNPSSPSTFYTPGEQDTTLGMVVLTLLVTEATGVCPLVAHPFTMTILDCACTPVTLADPGSALCNLDGALDLNTLVLIPDPGTWQITMTPPGASPATINGVIFDADNADPGPYQLTFTLDNPMPGCPASAGITVDVVDAPEYMAGPSQMVCSSDTVTLNGSVTGIAGSIQWMTTGAGIFTDPGSLITQYIPGPADIDSGFVMLILSGSDTAGVCAVDHDTMTVTFIDPPSGLMTDSVMVCNDSAVGSILDLTMLISGVVSWQDLSGLSLDLSDLSAVDFDSVPPGYYALQVISASAAPCEDIIDTLTVQVLNCICPQLVVNSLPEPICNAPPNAGVNLNAFLMASQPGTWSLVSTPAGSAPAVLTGAVLNAEGSDPGVYEVMFAFDVHVDGCPDSALLEVVVMEAPMAIAGTDTLICSDEVLQLNAVLNASATSVEWVSSGDGTFSSVSSPASVYVPGPVDLSSGQVQIGILAMDTTGVCATTEHTFVLSFQAAPFAEFSSMFLTICNVPDSGSVVDLLSLIIAGDQNGSWADVDMSGVDLTNPSQVDFDGIGPGVYQFSYTTNSAMPPCDEASYLISIEVESCLCPDLLIPDPPATLCNNNLFDLNTLLSTPQDGSWQLVNFNNYPSPPVVSGEELDLVDATAGTYRLDFTLTDSVPGCPASVSLLFDLEGVPQLMVSEKNCDFQDSTYSVLVVSDAMQLVNDDGELVPLGPGMFRIENIAFDQDITIMAFSSAGCSDEFYIEAPDCTCSIEIFNVPASVSFCPMDSIEVIAETEGPDIQSEYWLTPGDTVFGREINITTAGTFTFVVEASNGCRADTSLVTTQFPEIEATVEGFGPLCPGGNEGRIFVENIVGASLPLMYSLNNGGFQSIDTFPWAILGLTAGEYILIIRDANGCEISVEKILDDPAARFLELGRDVEIAQGDSVFIDPELNFIPNEFSYTPALLDSLSGWIRPGQSTLLMLEVIDLAGCVYVDEILITVEAAEVSEEIFAPGIFSPNGDQINDTWTLFAKDGSARVELLNIYNRWGGLLFSTRDFPVNDPSLGWDGTVNGEDMLPGVYVFMARILLSNGETLVLGGDITLIR